MKKKSSQQFNDFEPIIMMWDYYDGPREGLAHFRGKPCHFMNKFDDSIGDFPVGFTLKLVDDVFVNLAQKQWAIYENWQAKFNSGGVDVETHPGNKGVDILYDKLDDELEKMLKMFIPLTSEYAAIFSRNAMTVRWLEIP